MPHLFVDISAHGFGHLAQAAPVLNALAGETPDLHLTVRCALTEDRLRSRIRAPFAHIQTASDFGFAMRDALHIDLERSAAAYRAAHDSFSARIADEARLLQRLGADAVFSDVAYLPLAAAGAAGIPALALCSLNWADLFDHYYGGESWAKPIHGEMLAAYNSATFLRTTPGMPMPALRNVFDIGPIAQRGTHRRRALQEKVGVSGTARLILVALGGIPARLPVDRWPELPDTHWFVPGAWLPAGPGIHALEATGFGFADLLASVDAVITKPGYGTFTEAVCNGTAVLFQRRDDWPEQDCLIEWLSRHGRSSEITAEQLHTGNLEKTLERCLAQAIPPPPTFDGARQAAEHIGRALQR